MAAQQQTRMVILGLEIAEQNMRIRARKVGNLRGAIMRVLTEWDQVTKRNFDLSGGAHKPPQRWPGLAQSTLKQKAELGFSSKPLLRHGNLKRGWVLRVGNTRNSGIYRSTMPYAKYHHKGTSTIPKRRFIPKQAHASKIARRHIVGHVKVSIT